MEVQRSGGKTKRHQPLIRILDKLIVQDLLKTFISVWSVIVVIIVSREFVRILDKAIQGRVAHETLMSIFALKTLNISVALLPPALFMAVLMVLGRMYRDQEMSAVASAGGGAGTLYRAVFLLVLPLSIAATGLSFYAVPWSEASMAKIIHQDEESSDLRGIAAGKFSEYSGSDLVFYVEKITADKKMQQVFVQNRQKGVPVIINAQSARLQDSPDGRYVIFENGERIQGLPGNLDYVIEKFTEYAVRIEEKDTSVSFKQAATPTSALWADKTKSDIAELERRLNIPASILLLSFLAVPLARISPRGGVYGNMLVGFLIYFSYGNLSRLSLVWVVNGSVPAWFGGFGVNFFLALTGCFLLAREFGWQWLYLKIREKVS